MNIKEVETRSGLTRANIRFYEKEGLLSPARKENGYRDYSESDLACLQKIRLMRELGISLDQIKYLKEDPDSLNQLMEQRIQEADQEMMDLNDVITVCSEIRYDQVSFQNMNTDQYLERLKNLAEERNSRPDLAAEEKYESILSQDIEPDVPHPWKRFLARMLDLSFYDLLVALIWNGVFHQFSRGGFIEGLAMQFVALGFMAVLEPVFLSVFGTTPGKWIFGIHISKEDEQKLTYGEAFSRTGLVIRHGLGFRIPFFDLYCLFRNYKAYLNGAPLYWDRQDTEYQIQDRKVWKLVSLCFAAILLISLGNYGLEQYQWLPVNRGKLTVAEFAENYNRYYKQFSSLNHSEESLTSMLDEKGQYQQENNDMSISINLLSDEPVTWDYQEKNGEITQISFEQTLHTSGYITGYENEMVYAILAYVGAQDEISFWNGGMRSLVKQMEMENLAFNSYEFTKAGIHVSCRVEYEENLWTPAAEGFGFILPLDEKTEDYSIKFVMEKVE